MRSGKGAADAHDAHDAQLGLVGFGNGAADAHDAHDVHRSGWWGSAMVRLMLMMRMMCIAWADGLQKACG